MAKTMTITGLDGHQFTLEYTRKTVEMMERSGFVLDEVAEKPMTMLPTLFAGAFLAHHRGVKRDAIEAIYKKMPNKDKLIPVLVEMYNEPVAALMEEPEEGDEGNMSWTANW